MAQRGRVRVLPSVSAAIAGGEPVVALESAVITHGLPRSVAPGFSLGAPELDRAIGLAGAREHVPFALAVARAMAAAVAREGAIPAIVGVMRGELRIGLRDEELDELARDEDAAKASAARLPVVLADRRSAGTTVSATLMACAAAAVGGRAIRVMATGGIGGVHREWQTQPDLSADLSALARSPLAVVCSGPKSILDVPATAAVLESLGVPIVGVGTRDLPLFHAAGDGRVLLPDAVSSVGEAAAICSNWWLELGAKTAILFAHPVPREHAVPADEIERAIDEADRRLTRSGGERTPAILRELATVSEGRTLRANVALLLANASWAGRLARELARG